MFCNQRGGALKPCKDNPNQWAHIFCAMWLPGASFGDNLKLEPVTGSKDVLKGSKRRKCAYCQSSNGATRMLSSARSLRSTSESSRERPCSMAYFVGWFASFTLRTGRFARASRRA